MDDLRKQSAKVGADLRYGEVIKVDFSKRPFEATISDGRTILSDTVIIATGLAQQNISVLTTKKNSKDLVYRHAPHVMDSSIADAK